MAEKNPLDKFDEQLKCTVCLDTYTDPKVLLCNHAYCKACIDLLARNSRSITCPNCRKVTPIPENGVEDLQPAIQINSFLAIQDSLKKDRSATAGVAVSHCNEHGDEEVKLYCETCEKLICYQCVIKGAKHHKCEYGMLTELSDKYKGEIMASLEPVKKNLGTIDNAMELLAMRSEEITDLCDVVRTSIKDTIQQLQKALSVRQTQLLDQLQQIGNKKLAGLTDQTDAIRAVHTQLEQCRASVEDKLETSNEEEIVSVKSKLLMKIEEANSFFGPDDLIPNTEADVKFTSSAEATRICQSSGSFYARELLPDPTQCYATGCGLEAAKVGETASVVVHMVNVWGDPCEVQAMLQCRLVSEITSKKKYIYDTFRNVDQFEVHYTPNVKGQHQLHIEIGNRHIKGSPFTVRVKSMQYGDKIATFHADHPWGIVVNHKNEIIVSEYKKHCVSMFHPSGQKLRSFGYRGSEEGQFDHPYGVTVDDEDNILIADSKNNRIQKFSPYGRFLSAVGTKGRGGALEFSQPRDIAFSPFNKKLYVVDNSQNVQILNSDCSFNSMFMGYRGLMGVGGCWGVECDRYGKVYISMLLSFSYQISVFSAEGTLLVKSFGKLGLNSYPFSIAIDSHDTLLVSDYNKFKIYSFNLDGESLGSCGEGNLCCPLGIAIGDCDVLYVCDSENNRISLF